MKTMKQRALKACEKYLSLNGYDILETSWECPAGTIDIIAHDIDADTVAFTTVTYTEDASEGFSEKPVTPSLRSHLESIALSFLATTDIIDVPVRFDTIKLVVLGGDRAMLRHHVNALGTLG